MKKLFLSIMIVLFACVGVQAKRLFVEMEFHRNSIKLDDGSNKKHQPLTGKDGKDLKFNSLVGVLNYMSLQGWEFVDTKSVTVGASGSTDTKVFYIFSKEVPDEELEQAVKGSYKND